MGKRRKWVVEFKPEGGRDYETVKGPFDTEIQAKRALAFDRGARFVSAITDGKYRVRRLSKRGK